MLSDREPIYVLLTLLRLSCALVSATLINVTVDDQGADSQTGLAISYTPASNSWNLGQTCHECSTQPDPAQAFDGTWHDATYNSNVGGQTDPETATFEFTGE